MNVFSKLQYVNDFVIIPITILYFVTIGIILILSIKILKDGSINNFAIFIYSITIFALLGVVLVLMYLLDLTH